MFAHCQIIGKRDEHTIEWLKGLLEDIQANMFLRFVLSCTRSTEEVEINLVNLVPLFLVPRPSGMLMLQLLLIGMGF